MPAARPLIRLPLPASPLGEDSWLATGLRQVAGQARPQAAICPIVAVHHYHISGPHSNQGAWSEPGTADNTHQQ